MSFPVRKRLCAAVAAAVVASLLTVAGPAASAARPAGSVVTLVTGDRVTVSAGDGTRVIPVAGTGRTGMKFLISATGGHTYVEPVDAVPLISAGKLDRRLFDVTALQRDGFATAADLPLIVQGDSRSRVLPGVRSSRSLPAVKGAALRVARGDGTFWKSAVHDGRLADGVGRIWLDGRLRLSLKESVPQIGGPVAWAAGYTGQGVTVGVLDSGVDATHPDLAGRIAAARNFTAEPSTDDLVGHGTHVAATIASTDSVYRGVAPGASLVVAKVCGADGFCDISAVLEAMEWASSEQHVKVINMSMGGPDSPGVDPLEEAVDRLTAENGTLFVIGAGNDGTSGLDSTVASPSTADAALSVGAVDKQNRLASFSAAGPRLADYAIKPEVTAPGVDIVAARAANGTIGNTGQTHASASGTSMAAPHATGAAAILFSQHPGWTPARVKAALIGSATSTADSGVFHEGAGRIDLAKAVHTTVLVDPPAVSFGLAAWPHTDDQPIRRTLTYANTGDAAVTLALTAGDTGVFALSADTLTVPAGGSASVEVTATTSGGGPDGTYSGVVTATAADQVVRTPVGVVREPESYDVTVRPLDRDGRPAARSGVLVGDFHATAVDADGTAHFRLPKGTYVLAAEIDGSDLLVAPNLEITGDQDILADARTAKPITVSVPRADATPQGVTVGFVTRSPDGAVGGMWMDVGDPADVRTGQIGPDAPAGRFAGAMQAVFTGPSYVYNLDWFTPNVMYTGTRTVRDAELASVTTKNLPRGSGTTAIKGSMAFSTALPGASFPGFPTVSMFLPHIQEELFTTEGVAWFTVFQQGEGETEQQAFQRVYQAGRKYTERWNGGAVDGPSLPGGDVQPAAWVRQFPNGIRFAVPLFGQAADTAGASPADSAHATLLRDGVPICETVTAVCSAPGIQPAARFTASTTQTRSVGDTSTRVDVTWDVAYDGKSALPVQVVRFSPQLTDTNAAPGGRTFAVPVTVQRNPNSPASTVKSLTVYASMDDGAHWRQVPIEHGTARVDNPASGYVSLRAKAVDRAGNSVDQTIIRAYRVARP